MQSRALAVYLIESGRTELQTDKVDILTPRDERGVEMVISVDADEVVISQLFDTVVKERLKITLADLK